MLAMNFASCCLHWQLCSYRTEREHRLQARWLEVIAEEGVRKLKCRDHLAIRICATESESACPLAALALCQECRTSPGRVYLPNSAVYSRYHVSARYWKSSMS